MTSRGQADRRYQVTATVLESPRHGPMLCLGALLTSYPPQGGDVPITNWNWDDVHDKQSASGTTWGDYSLVGTYDGHDFTLTQPPTPAPRPATPQQPAPLHHSPCTPPPGGWRPSDTSRISHETLEQARDYARRQHDLAGIWIDRPRPTSDLGQPDDPTNVVLHAKFTHHLDQHEHQLRQRWGGALCIARYRHSAEHLRRVQAEVFPTGARQMGLHPLGAGLSEPENLVLVHVVRADDRDQQAVDERYGQGIVSLISRLRPAE